jgi:EAL domain-containing protein (putative c-di-GMP-specific phosphodiesterase class I)
VEAIVQMAQTLRLDTVAEGIEVRDQLAGLRSVGCHCGQGFLFARPLESEALGAFLRRPDEASPAVA